MPWLKDEKSLAYKIYAIYTDTLKVFLQPQIGDLFNDGRKKTRDDLLRKLHTLLKEVYKLEMSKRKDQSFDDEYLSQ
jgi:hypothetical protein